MGFAGEGDASGSNNWAVAGSRTAGGKPVLASDPHQPFWLPSSWYEYGLHGPDDEAVGAGHPGVPAMFWGMNGRIAWGITNDGSSTRDLYREAVHPDNPALYRDGDRWLPFVEEEIVVAVRGREPERHVRRSTVRGPICNAFLTPVREGGDPPLALRWVGQEPIDDVQTLLRLNRAQSWSEFRDALEDWAIPIFNWVCADVEGNIGYQQAGRVCAVGSSWATARRTSRSTSGGATSPSRRGPGWRTRRAAGSAQPTIGPCPMAIRISSTAPSRPAIASSGFRPSSRRPRRSTRRRPGACRTT
jgi:acyl-homoserine lactone acylase PvdQ